MYAELQLCTYHVHATLRMQHCVYNIMHAHMRDHMYVRVHMHDTVLERVRAYIQHMHIIYMPYIYDLGAGGTALDPKRLTVFTASQLKIQCPENVYQIRNAGSI